MLKRDDYVVTNGISKHFPANAIAQVVGIIEDCPEPKMRLIGIRYIRTKHNTYYLDEKYLKKVDYTPENGVSVPTVKRKKRKRR